MTATKKDPGKVVLQFTGGNDYYSTVIPYNDPLYVDNRPAAGYPLEDVIRIDDPVKGGMYDEYPSRNPEGLDQGDREPNYDSRGGYTTLVEDWLGLDAKPTVNRNFEKFSFLKARTESPQKRKMKPPVQPAEGLHCSPEAPGEAMSVPFRGHPCHYIWSIGSGMDRQPLVNSKLDMQAGGPAQDST